MRRPEWDVYESAVMEGRPETVEPPGDDYVMSDAFREWLVARMRDEVLGNVGMAVLKAQPTSRSSA